MKIFSLLAMLIIIAHSTISHSHHSDFNELDHETHYHQIENIIDYVALVFHNEQQDDELEEFVTIENNINVDLSIFKYFILFYQPIDFINSENYTDNNFNQNLFLLEQFCSESFSLRGPPLYS